MPLFFTVCGATRLARFNVQTRVMDKRFFAGLPIPAGAGTVASLLFFAPDPEWRRWLQVAMLVALVALGTLMVSTFRYRSFKQFDLRQRHSYRLALLLAALVLLVVWKPRVVLVTVAVVYTLSGPVGWLVGRLRRSPSTEATSAATDRDELSELSEDPDREGPP